MLGYKNPVHPNYVNKMFGTIFGYSGLLDTVLPTAGIAVSVAKAVHGEKDNSLITEIGDWLHETFGDRTKSEPAELVLFGDEDWSLDKDYDYVFGEASGVVKDKDSRKLLAGVEISALNTISFETSKTYTDENGVFYFNLPEGQYTIVLALKGYMYVDEDVDIIITRNTSITLPSAIYMQKIIEDGYIGIYTPQDLNNIRHDLSGSYILMKDIDLASWGDWVPIGNGVDVPLAIADSFVGVFDGDGYTIKNMTINVISNNVQVYAGLFACIGNATVKNTGVVNSIINATATTTSKNGFVGGIAGGSSYSTISNCYFTGEMKTSSTPLFNLARVGGIVGSNDNTEISNCYNLGEINAIGTNTSYAGGIAGYNSSSVISNCYNRGTVNAVSTAIANYTSHAGGIAGTGSSINNCYNTGIITGMTNTVEISPRVGGIAGFLAGARINNSYYLDNINTAGFNDIFNGGILTNVYSLTEAQMKQQASFVGFDFTDVWAINPAINNGYPYLRGMQP